MHHRRGCAHHPAVLRTFAHHGTHLLRPGALPYLHEIGRLVDVAHRFLPVFLFQSIAGIDVAEGVDEEIGGSGLARQHTPAAFDVVDQPHVEPSPEPALGVVLLQLPRDQLLEVPAYFVFVGNDVVVLVEIVGVVDRCRCELHPQRFAQLIQRKHVPGVVVRYGTAESDVLQAHLL